MGNFNKINCCGIEQKGRVFELPPKYNMKKSFIFIDECCKCLQPVAIIKQINSKGIEKIIVRRSGAKAINLFNKIQKINPEKFYYKTKNSSKSNMGWFWIDGLIDLWVRDFNGTKKFRFKS